MTAGILQGARRVVAAPGRVVWLLGLTQIVGYGTLYYSFGILASAMAATLDWPTSRVYGAFSVALLASGLFAPRVGRLADRHGAGRVMAVGSALAAAALALMAAASGPASFTAALVLVQVAGALVLYDTAFAAIVQSGTAEAGRAITHLTLVAGFASTLFWPLTTWLATVLDWHLILLVFAAANLLVCLPVHLAVARQSRTAAKAADPARPALAAAPETPLPPHRQRRAMILVALGFSLGGFFLSAILSQMVPVLAALGLGSAAVTVSALFGPSQVAVRFANMMLGQSRHPVVAAVLCTALFPVAACVLAATAPSIAGAAAFAAILGFGSGLKSIVQGTLPLALFGRFGYAERLGRIASVRLALSAAAPYALAWLIDAAGAIRALLLMALIGVMGLAALIEVARMCRAGQAGSRTK